MNLFYINNKEYKTDATILDHINIKSIPKSYKVWLGSSPQDAFLCNDPGDVFVIDKNVYDLYYNSDIFSHHKDSIFLVEATEEKKSIETVLELTKFLLQKNFTKKSKVIAIGGGITQDITAFCAATYKRGIKWVYFPTTLLSMCDSCIGGKTGINFNNIKNQLALFSSPTQVHLAPHFLSTLSDDDIKSGLGECIKLFKMAGERSLDIYKECVKDGTLIGGKEVTLVREALQIKRAVVEEDEFETGNRTALNYGHTIGHALEVATNYRIPHGKAVAIGCIVEDNICKESSGDNIAPLVRDLIQKDIEEIDIDYDLVFSLVKKDRKVLGNKIKIATSPQPGTIIFDLIDLDEKFKNKMESYLRAIV